VRRLDQLQAAIETEVQTLYCEFEDPRAYREAVQLFRRSQASPTQTIWVAPPRITKPGEQWILEQVRRCEADGYLVRNADHLDYFAGDRRIGDFSLNIANALTADYFKQLGLERLTASYDLNVQQLSDLLKSCPPEWFEITLHQHMPMFHMEHCVFCAFLSDGKDFRDCGRPCETHEVKLRDRAGKEHPLQADAGCRNTVFNSTAQTGAEYINRLQGEGGKYFRLEFLQDSPAQVTQTILQYQKLLQGEITGAQLWKASKLQNQLGVTRGTLA
jgi:U32 family peptidase